MSDNQRAVSWYERLLASEPEVVPKRDGGGAGIEPASHRNCVRKVIYRHPDGNEIGFGASRLK